MPRSFSLLRLFLLSSGLLSSLGAQSPATAVPVFNWTTLAGRAGLGHEDGPAAQARFNHPYGLARDTTGNIYVADGRNSTIRKIAPDGTVSTLAGSPGQRGSADGIGAAARFETPEGLAVDGSGNVYVADTLNFAVRKITPAGVVTTVAGQLGKSGYVDGPAAGSLFGFVGQIGADATGNIYVATEDGIRRISGGIVTTFYAGSTITDADGRAYTITPGDSLAVTPAGVVYSVAQAKPWAGPGLCIVRLDATGTATFALPPAAFGVENAGTPMDMVGALAPDGADGFYFFFSQRVYYGHENEIAHWTPTAYNWIRSLADIHNRDIYALGIAQAPSGELLYTTGEDNSVRILGSFLAYAGTPWSPAPVDGPGASARFSGLGSLAVDASGNIWAGDSTYRRITDDFYGAAYLRKITPDGTTTTVYATDETTSPVTQPMSLAADGSGQVYFGLHTYYQTFRRFAPDGSSVALPDPFTNTSPLTEDTAASPGGLLALTTFRGAVYKLDPAASQWSLLAGAQGDDDLPIVRKDGAGAAAVLGNLWAIAADRQGNFYVLDSDETDSTRPSTTVIRQITPAGVVTTLSRDLIIRPSTINLGIRPFGLAVGSAGQFYLYYEDYTVRLLTSSGDPVVIGGVPLLEGHEDGRGTAAHFGYLTSLAIDAQDNLYVNDNGAIRKGQFVGYAPVFTAQPAGGTFAAGSAVTLSVAASGTPAPTFQWYRDGVSLAGSTAATLKIASLNSASTGSYTVTATNTAGSALSTAAVVSLETAAPPPPPPPSGGSSGSSGGGGGGAPSPWFLGVLLALTVIRKFRDRG